MKKEHWFLKEILKTTKSKALIIKENSIFIKFKDGIEMPFIIWSGANVQIIVAIEKRDGNDFVVELRDIDSFDDVLSVIGMLIRELKKEYNKVSKND